MTILWQWRGCRADVCEKKPETVPSQKEPVLAGSAVNPPQDMVVPIRKTDSASEKMYLRNRGKHHGGSWGQQQEYETTKGTPMSEEKEEFHGAGGTLKGLQPVYKQILPSRNYGPGRTHARA